eukprot:3153194-Prorocentrum_lima.AAC.1
MQWQKGLRSRRPVNCYRGWGAAWQSMQFEPPCRRKPLWTPTIMRLEWAGIGLWMPPCRTTT